MRTEEWKARHRLNRAAEFIALYGDDHNHKSSRYVFSDGEEFDKVYGNPGITVHTGNIIRDFGKSAYQRLKEFYKRLNARFLAHQLLHTGYYRATHPALQGSG